MLVLSMLLTAGVAKSQPYLYTKPVSMIPSGVISMATASTYSQTNFPIIDLRYNGGIALSINSSASGIAAAQSYGIQLQVSTDGVNWTTSAVNTIIVTNILYGQTFITNIPPSAFSGAKKARIELIRNGASGTLVFTNITASFWYQQ